MVLSNSVFISYRRDVGGLWALAVYQQLHEHGIDAFYDIESLRQSGQFNAMLLEQIAARPYFLLVLTPGTLDRCDKVGDWLRREIDQALATERIVVPLHTATFDYADIDRVFPAEAAARLASFSGVELSHTYFKAAVQRLTEDFLKPVPADDRVLAAEEEADRRAAAEIALQEPTVSPQILEAQEHFLIAHQRDDEDHAGKIAEYTEAIRLHPEFARAYLFRGLAREAAGDLSGAAADVEAAAYLDPHDAEAHEEAWRLAQVVTAEAPPSTESAATGSPAAAPPPIHEPIEAQLPDDDHRRPVVLAMIGAAAALAVLFVALLAWVRSGDDSSDPTTLPPTTNAPTTNAPTTSGRRSASTALPEPAERLTPGDRLLAGEQIESVDGRHMLAMGDDGELVASTDGAEWWRQPDDAPSGAVAVMQDDGNLVVYPSLAQIGRDALWASGTFNHPGAELVIDEDGGYGRVAIIDTDGTVLWDESARPEPERVPVPEVRDLTEAAALAQLEDDGFDVEIVAQSSDAVALDNAIGTEPAAGTELRRGSDVVLFVSSGPGLVTVPSVTGLAVYDAIQTIESAQLVADAQISPDGTAAIGVVVEQDPPAGAQMARGSIVTIFYGDS